MLPGTYTITETVAPLGYVIDADPTRVVTVTVGDLTQVIGVQGFNDTGRHRRVRLPQQCSGQRGQHRLGEAGHRRRPVLLGGAQFTISPNPTDGVGMLTILDNGPGRRRCLRQGVF